MREIKFRGKRIDNGEWVYGYLIKDSYDILCISRENDLKHIDGLEYRFDGEAIIPETIGQFTGLKDKKGKEIYEDDLIAITNPYDGIEPEGSAVIIFSHDYVGGWIAKYNENKCNIGTRIAYIRVVGNIHDNSLLPANKE